MSRPFSESMTPTERDEWAAEGQSNYYAEKKSTKSNHWPEPKALPSGLTRVDTFNLEFLPQRLGPWVGDISDRMQCPPDFIGVTAMVALGASIGRKVGIRPQRQTDWVEVPNLWGMIVGRPGLMKSPAMQEALKPLQRIETNARKAYEHEAKSYELETEAFKIFRAKAQKEAMSKGGDPRTILANLIEPQAPVARRYVVNDTSYESLGEIMANNPNGVLVFRDELVSLLKTLDREEFAAARGFYLSAWNGTGGYTFDRIMRGHKHIEAACLSLIGSTQPGKIAEYIRRATSGSGSDDGLIQRFGLFVWPDQSLEWRDVDRYPDSNARHSAWATFEAFDGLSPEVILAQRDEFSEQAYLRFDDTAQSIFGEWRLELEARLRSDELSPALESHLAKYRKLVPSLALINHLAEGCTGPVCETAILRALAFAEYLESHAKRVYAAGSEAETTSAKAILKHIRNGELQDGFTQRDVHQHGWSNLTDRDAVKAGLDLLNDLDWIASETISTRGRPRTTFKINPRVLI